MFLNVFYSIECRLLRKYNCGYINLAGCLFIFFGHEGGC